MAEPTAIQNERLGHLFELELQFQWEMPLSLLAKAGEGEYIGSGEGAAKGPTMHGTVRWDLFEKREETLCRSNLTGVIETNDGAQIRFDSRDSSSSQTSRTRTNGSRLHRCASTRQTGATSG